MGDIRGRRGGQPGGKMERWIQLSPAFSNDGLRGKDGKAIAPAVLAGTNETPESYG